MKITRQRLEEIIKEELAVVLKELDLPTGPTAPGELAADADRDCAAKFDGRGTWDSEGKCVDGGKQPPKRLSPSEQSYAYERDWPPGFPE